MNVIALVLFLVAAVLFLLATFGLDGRLQPAGLTCTALAFALLELGGAKII